MATYTNLGNALHIRAANEQIETRPWGENSLRVRARMTGEPLVRWFQWGALCPVMRLHGDRDPHTSPRRQDGTETPFTGGDNEVWSFGEENYPILKKYMELRETMRDYVRDLMRQAHEDGSPVMRPMFYEFPVDKACWELKDQHMFGADVLVAPVMAPGAVSRSVYLPSGCAWTDMRDGQVHQGGQMVEAQTPIQSMPVFLKNGAHPIGYDVHDVVETPDVLAPGMVFCVDVGIYHEKWGIGFRLEDNCLVAEDGCENLSAAIPRTIEDIEREMAR